MNKRSVKKQAAKTTRSSVARKPSSARKAVGKILASSVGKSVAKGPVAKNSVTQHNATAEAIVRHARPPEAIPAAAITVPSAAHTVAPRDTLFRTHKFRVGQTVLFTSSPITRPGASGTYKVISLLPSDGDDYQYRIKNSGEAFERVAKESQLENEH
jgi:hypothetical protein